jgi:hypothetical protein
MEKQVIVVDVLRPSIPRLVNLLASRVCAAKSVPEEGSKSSGVRMNHPHLPACLGLRTPLARLREPDFDRKAGLLFRLWNEFSVLGFPIQADGMDSQSASDHASSPIR